MANHLLVNRLCHSEETTHVGIDYLVPCPISCGREIIAAVDGRIVNQNVDPAPLLHNFSSHSFQAQSIRDRNFETNRTPLMSFDFRDGCRSEIVSTVEVESDIGAFPRKNFADSCANAAGSSGYERALTFEQ